MKTYPRDTPEYLGTNTRGVNPKTCFFYPTALKGCRGIVFTHDVPMGGRAGGWPGGGK